MYDLITYYNIIFSFKFNYPNLQFFFFIAIRLIEDAGAKIYEIISDGASTNRKFWECFKVNGKLKNTKCSFTHPMDDDRKIFVFSDTPHLIKTIRNRMENKTGTQAFQVLKHIC